MIFADLDAAVAASMSGGAEIRRRWPNSGSLTSTRRPCRAVRRRHRHRPASGSDEVRDRSQEWPRWRRHREERQASTYPTLSAHEAHGADMALVDAMTKRQLARHRPGHRKKAVSPGPLAITVSLRAGVWCGARRTSRRARSDRAGRRLRGGRCSGVVAGLAGGELGRRPRPCRRRRCQRIAVQRVTTWAAAAFGSTPPAR